MGVITIEVPQRVKRTYRISTKASGEAVISGVEKLVRSERHEGRWSDDHESGRKHTDSGREKDPGPGSRKDDEYQDAMDAAFGMWSYRNESTDQIARKLRDGWNRSNGK